MFNSNFYEYDDMLIELENNKCNNMILSSKMDKVLEFMHEYDVKELFVDGKWVKNIILGE